jgi:hypothetical protein
MFEEEKCMLGFELLLYCEMQCNDEAESLCPRYSNAGGSVVLKVLLDFCLIHMIRRSELRGTSKTRNCVGSVPTAAIESIRLCRVNATPFPVQGYHGSRLPRSEYENEKWQPSRYARTSTSVHSCCDYDEKPNPSSRLNQVLASK